MFGFYDDEIITIPSKKLVIRGVSQVSPTLGQITASEGTSIDLTLKNFLITGQKHLIRFIDNPIRNFVLNSCSVNVKTSLSLEPAILINATNYENELGNIEISQSIFSPLDIPTSMVIESSHPLTVALNLTYNIINFHTIEFKNIANLTADSTQFGSENIKLNSGLVLLNQNSFMKSEIYVDKYLLSNWTDNNITDSNFIIDSDCYPGLGLCMNHFEMWENDFVDTNIEFKKENRIDQSYRNITMRHNQFFLLNLKDKFKIENKMEDTVVDLRQNYFSHRNGPTICSNPNGRGYSVSLMVDYSFWCLSANCVSFNREPQLLKDTLKYPCHTYYKGTIASIVIFSLIFVVGAGVTFAMFFFKFAPTTTNKVHAAQYCVHLLSLGLSIFTFYSLGLPIASKIVNSKCQTRVPAPSCVFTVLDSSISSILLMLLFAIVFSNIASTAIASTRHLRKYCIYYMFIVIKIASICFPAVLSFEILTLILDYMSSRVMVVALITLIIIMIGEGLNFSYLIRLKKNIKEVSLIFDDINEYGQRALLGENNQNAPENEGRPQILPDDQYIFNYSDYKTKTLTVLVSELIALVVLFPFTIWFTTKYIAPGIYSIFVVVGNIARVIQGMILLRGSRAKIHDLYMILASISGIAAGVIFIICGALIFVDIEVNASVFFVIILTAVWAVPFVLSYDKTRTIRLNLTNYIRFGNSYIYQQNEERNENQQNEERNINQQNEGGLPPTYENNNYVEI